MDKLLFEDYLCLKKRNGMPVIGMKDMPDTRQKKYKVPESEVQSADMLQPGRLHRMTVPVKAEEKR